MIRATARWLWLTLVRGWLYVRLGVEIVRETLRG